MDANDLFNATDWLVDRHVRAGHGDDVALLCADRKLTYAGLQEAVWAAARGLRSLGVQIGDRVVMVVNDTEAFPAVLLGAMRLGAVPIPVSTMLRGPDVAVLAADSEAKVVVLSGRYAGYLAAIADAAPSVKAAVIIEESPEAEPSPASGDGLAVHAWSSFTDRRELPTTITTAGTAGFWLYTSGTTGQPKGAIHLHGDLKAICDTYARTVLGIAAGDVCYSVPKLFFAFGLGNALVFPFSVGATAVLDPEPPTPVRAGELLARHRPTFFFAPPGFCAAMVDAGLPADALADTRYTVTAGEALPPEVMRRFRERFGVEMLDGIGSTEALHIFCSNHPGDVRPGTSGRPVEGYELRLLDDAGAEVVEADTPGYLWVRGASVTTGYWNRPETNDATFADGWCRTGDVYLRSADGYYRFFGRNSDMIKAGGIWVSPAEVEHVLLQHDDVLEAAVVGGRDSDGLETTVAFVVPRTGHTIDPMALDTHCRAQMASFKRPRQFHVVTGLPKTATGKIQRYALRARLGSGPEVPA